MTTITKTYQTANLFQSFTVTCDTSEEALAVMKKVEDEDEVRAMQPKRETRARMDC